MRSTVDVDFIQLQTKSALSINSNVFMHRIANLTIDYRINKGIKKQ